MHSTDTHTQFTVKDNTRDNISPRDNTKLLKMFTKFVWLQEYFIV